MSGLRLSRRKFFRWAGLAASAAILEATLEACTPATPVAVTATPSPEPLEPYQILAPDNAADAELLRVLAWPGTVADGQATVAWSPDGSRLAAGTITRDIPI